MLVLCPGLQQVLRLPEVHETSTAGFCSHVTQVEGMQQVVDDVNYT